MVLQRRTTFSEPLLALQGKTTILFDHCMLSLLLSLSLSILSHLFNKWTFSSSFCCSCCRSQVQKYSGLHQHFLLSLFTFPGLLQQSFHNPQYFSHFLILLFRLSFYPSPSLLPFTNRIVFDSIADPYDYTRLWTFMSVGKVFLNVVIFWLKVDEHRGDFEELWDAWSWGQLAIGNCPALSGERIYPDIFVQTEYFI